MAFGIHDTQWKEADDDGCIKSYFYKEKVMIHKKPRVCDCQHRSLLLKKPHTNCLERRNPMSRRE